MHAKRRFVDASPDLSICIYVYATLNGKYNLGDPNSDSSAKL